MSHVSAKPDTQTSLETLALTNLTALGTSGANQGIIKTGSATFANATLGGTPGGSTTQVQYNNAGAFGSISGATTDGTILTLTNPIIAGATLTTSSINGVTLTTGGGTTTFLNANGAYSAPVGTVYTGTTNRVTVVGTVIDISASYVGQSSITTLGTIGTGIWQGTSITTTFTDAKVKTVAGTLNRIAVGGTATDPTFDISSSYVGQSSITTLGTIGTGVWNGTAIANANLANSKVTIGSTDVSLGTTVTTFAGLVSVTSTTFVGALTGNATTASSAAKWTTARNLAGNSVDGSGNVAFANAFIVQGTVDAGLSAAQFLGALGTGIVKNTTSTGVLSIAINSDLPVMSATVGGAVPTPPNNTTTFLRGDGTFATPAGSGDMVLASIQTVTGAKTFNDTKFLLQNVAGTFNGSFVNTNTANRIYTLKDAPGTLAFTSDITGTNSGTNTGDQTITLTGAVTGTGTTTFATTLATPGTLTVATTNSNVTAHTHAITSSSAPGAAASILATDSSGIIGLTGTRIVKIWAIDLTVTNTITGAVSGNAGTVSNATFTTALTVNGGTLTLTANAANTSVLTIGAGAVSISGASSGTNTGDQTSIVGITGTKAQFNTAVTDGDIMYLDSIDTITAAKTFSTAPVFNALPTGTAVASIATVSTLVSRDASANTTINNLIEGYRTTATAGGTTTLVVGDTYQQFFTGTNTQTVVMPVVSGLVLGMSWLIVNNSTGKITVQASGGAGNEIIMIDTNTSVIVTCILTSGTSAASWSAETQTIEMAFELNGGGDDIPILGVAINDPNWEYNAAGDVIPRQQTFINWGGNMVPGSDNMFANTGVAVLTDSGGFSSTPSISQIINPSNAITASGNAATVPITSRLSTVTNNSAATLTVTMTTAKAVDGQMIVVRILDFSAVAQTITWVNIENSTVTAPTTSNGSTTLPVTVGFMYNSLTSLWRCIASA